jgi:hypothetical protein
VTPGTQRFSVLALLYLVTNARIGSGEKRRRVQRVMTRPEREAITAVMERLPAKVASWSDGLAVLEPMHLVEVRRQLTSLSSSGEGRWWAGPRDCREELAELAVDPSYDSVFVLWPSAPDVQLCGWGCTVGPSEATLGAGFTSIATDHWETLATDPDPEQGYVHEWLHQVEAIYRALGLTQDELPPLHDAAAFTSTRPADEPPFGRSYAEYHDGSAVGDEPAADTLVVPPARTWAPWYRDWMTGRLRHLEPANAGGGVENGPIGLIPERWAMRSR